ncbi:hypothetical protein F6U93_01105 [Tamlana haliotis]|uniref:Uncharacterized protein n=1 Tax=Pseudotamlana haliotis TaxID=2614804 RepID=A0A6N6MLZ9_9FLAO|nr:hypothetical protein [Tamlana haliotis]KAB1071354.1 hypothetical protein F6U93_01105 [Tamlana haliotis]
MKQKPTPKEVVLDLDFDFNELKETLENTHIGEGSHLNPILLDFFVKNDLKGFFLNLVCGESVQFKLNFPGTSIVPKLYYLKFINLSKASQTFMSLEDWQEHIIFKKNDKHSSVAPDGSLFVKPRTIKESNEEYFLIKSKDKDQSDCDLKDLYLYYTIVLSFEIDNKEYYFKIDPFVKIHSKHN